MKVIRKINNNVELCLDGNNNEVIAFGKGIGFRTPPYEIELSQIHRTYYHVDKVYINMINDIPEDIIELSAAVIDYAKARLQKAINPNIVFTLADHICFAVRRYEEHMNITLPILYDIQYLFEVEMDIGKKALSLIRKNMGVLLPDEEAAYIALHIVNAEAAGGEKNNVQSDEKLIDAITDIIEDYFEIKIDKSSFNYSRFVTHMNYLLIRGKKDELIKGENGEIYEVLTATIPEVFDCSLKVKEYMESLLDWELSKDENVYLMLHINRLCSREDCYH